MLRLVSSYRPSVTTDFEATRAQLRTWLAHIVTIRLRDELREDLRVALLVEDEERRTDALYTLAGYYDALGKPWDRLVRMISSAPEFREALGRALREPARDVEELDALLSRYGAQLEALDLNRRVG